MRAPVGQVVGRVVFAALVAVTLACGPGKPPEEPPGDYVGKITKLRENKDAAFRAPCCSDSSPVPDAKKSEFLPLQYYPIDESYKVPAVLTPSADRTIFQMPTSSGQPRNERRAGTLTFTLHGQEMKLTAFVEADAPNMDRLFLPFSDSTSGKDTYAGGRFLDLERSVTGLYELDFNLAYTPYCYYNPTFECPYPPQENRLKLPIEAGEKIRKP